MRLLAAVLACWGALAAAEPFPALYDVIDVEANDVLNIRQAPTAKAPIIGAFAPDAAGIEVIALDETRRWARVRAGERMGWAFARFLLPVPQQGEGFGQGLTCYGTEPFWELSYLPFAASSLSFLGGAVDSFDLPFPRRAEGRPDVYGLSGPGGGADLFGVLRRGLCSDGMSDLEFGLSLDLILHAQDDLVFSGCCSIGAR